MVRKLDPYLMVGIMAMIIIMCWIGIVHGSNSTSNMTLDCVRMFYSDSWDKGYVVDLAKFCSGGS